MIAIGRRRGDDPDGLIELLLDCHARIRSFIALAQALAGAGAASPTQVRDAAHRVRRYFAEALPLHVQDEEETIVPRLLGREPELDAALERMSAEHGDHRDRLAMLVAWCQVIEADPGALDGLRVQLGHVAESLAADFVSHLENEEGVIFPAIARLLSADEQAAMVAELRARRTTVLAPPA